MIPAVCVAAVLAAIPPNVRIAILESRVKALERESGYWRQRADRLHTDLLAVIAVADPAKLAADVRRDRVLTKLIREGSKDPQVRAEADAVRTRLDRFRAAGRLPEVMIRVGVLKDGLSRKEAEDLLGPPTDDRDGFVEWYHNGRDGLPRMHVAPYVRAAATKDGLAGWKAGLR